MLSWHRFRLLACIVVMLGMLAVGGYAWLRWGVPAEPYMHYPTHIAREVGPVPCRTADPFCRLDFELWCEDYFQTEQRQR
jgi:hypothetical protein